MEETPKYLTLDGYPLDKPLWKTFHQSTGFRIGMLCSAFTVATDLVANGTQHLLL